MIYKNHKIVASVPDWHYYEVKDDGTLGEFRGNGGVDADAAEYEIYMFPGTDREEVWDGGYGTIEAAKKSIDEHVKYVEKLHAKYGGGK